MKSKYWLYGILALAVIGIIFISGCVQQPKPETVQELSKEDINLFSAKRIGLIGNDIEVSAKINIPSYCKVYVDDNVVRENLDSVELQRGMQIWATHSEQHDISLCCYASEDINKKEVCVSKTIMEKKTVEKTALEENFELKDGEIKYFYFSVPKTGHYSIFVNAGCSNCDENYFNVEFMTLEECHRKQGSLSYQTLYQKNHVWNDFFYGSEPLEEDTDFCIAITHNDYKDRNVVKHIRIETDWLE